MTLTAATASVEVQAPAWAFVLRKSVPTIATGVVLAWWATGLVRGGGGRDVNSLAIGLLALAIALVAVRPWRHVPIIALVIPVLLSLAALVILPVGGVGRAGAVAAGAYVFAGALVVLVGSWTSSADRASVLAAAICLAGLAEVCWAFPAWWAAGVGVPGPMVGTFYWWNPYAIYLLAPALLGLLLAVNAERPWRAVGWLTTPFLVSAVLFSTSRASIACLGVGWSLVSLGLIWRSPHRRFAIVRVVLLSTMSIAMAYVLTSPLLFRSHVSPFGAMLARHSAGQSVSSDGGYRVDFWRQAVSAFRHQPVTGTGYGRLQSVPNTLHVSATSPLAHNGFLQALGEGGLVLAIPMAVALIGAAFLLLAAIRRPAAWHGIPFVAGIAGLGLIAHGLVDTDWSYPADPALLSICVALAAAPRWHRDDPEVVRRPRLRLVVGSVLAALVFISGALALGQHFSISLSGPNIQPGATS